MRGHGFIKLVSVFGLISLLGLTRSAGAQSAQEWLDKGIEQLEREEYAAALLSLSRALQKDSLTLWQAYTKRGYARLHLQIHLAPCKITHKQFACSASILMLTFIAPCCTWRGRIIHVALPIFLQ
jgi:hypothetical protein